MPTTHSQKRSKSLARPGSTVTSPTGLSRTPSVLFQATNSGVMSSEGPTIIHRSSKISSIKRFQHPLPSHIMERSTLMIRYICPRCSEGTSHSFQLSWWTKLRTSLLLTMKCSRDCRPVASLQLETHGSQSTLSVEPYLTVCEISLRTSTWSNSPSVSASDAPKPSSGEPTLESLT